MRERSTFRFLGVLALVAVLSPLTGSAAQSRPEAAARWRTIMNQRFESSFPVPNWAVRDYNGSVGGTAYWDDEPTRGHAGFWSAHPADAATYADQANTWMRYGPFSLAGARDARMTFWRWMDTEPIYDLFSWGYSCTGLTGFHETSASGHSGAWVQVTQALKPCAGRPEVYVIFRFMSDVNTAGPGVWVDDILIQKFS